MKKIIAMLFAALIFVQQIAVFASENNTIIYIHSKTEDRQENAILVNATTMIGVRIMANMLGMNIIWHEKTKEVVLWDDELEISLVIGQAQALVNSQNMPLSHPAIIVNDSTYLPLRNLAEATEAKVEWNSETKNTDVYLKSYYEKEEEQIFDELENDEENKDQPDVFKKLEFLPYDGETPFFSQRGEEWGFENNGSGYCWVCCYAMALTNATGLYVTPQAVATINSRKGDSKYVQHADIIAETDASFAQAISEDSPYFKEYDQWRGATYINAESDEEAALAIKEALIKNPQGVMVRYTIYPHTLFAVGFLEDKIYFNEPAFEDGEYVTFEETCLKNYKLSDLDYLQAIEKK